MLIIIILAALVILGIVLCNKGHEFAGPLTTMFSGGILFACIIVIMFVQIPAEHDYQKTLYEKEVIEYRIENQDNNIVGNELLYNDIIEFNNELRDTKRYANSWWTNWFNNAKIASIDYIEIPGLN